MRYLITQTLLSSWAWNYKLNKDGSELMSTFKKEKIEPNENMLKGIHFENMVRRYDSGEPVDITDNQYLNRVREVAEIISGGTWQVSASKEITVNGIDFLLNGKADVIRGPEIFDIKFTKKYEYPKYRDAIQHIIYQYMFDSPVFHYVISTEKEVFMETYQQDKLELKIKIQSELNDFISWLAGNPEYEDVFRKNWVAKEYK